MDATPVYEKMFRRGDRTALKDGDLFHFDISNDPRAGRADYELHINNHPLAAEGLLCEGITSDDFLVLLETTLHERLETRTEFSNDINSPLPAGPYNSTRKLEILASCPVVDRCSMWFDYFDDRKTRIRYIHSGTRRYAEIADRQSALEVLTARTNTLGALVHEDAA